MITDKPTNLSAKDHCANGKDGCDRTNGKCVNEPNGFHCECNKGYKLAADGKTCEGTMNDDLCFLQGSSEKT